MGQQATYKIRLQLYTGLALIYALITNAHASAQFMLPPAHQSSYSVEKFHTHMGDMYNTLRFQDDIVKYASIAKATGVAAMFVKEDLKETSILSWPKDQGQAFPQQQSFSYIQSKGNKKNQHISFSWPPNWDTHKNQSITIDGIYKHRAYRQNSRQVVWSRQMLPLLMSSDLQLNPDIKSNSIHIIDKGHIEKFTYTLEAKENMLFEGKNIAVVKYKIIKDGSSRSSYAWLSKNHYYLPLKLEQYKGDTLNMRMLMTQFKLINND